MTQAAEDLDRRSQRTRKAVFDAFTRLIFSRRYGAIRTSDLIEEAGVGRSTFYEHFRNKDDVMVWAIDPIFAPLAEAAAGKASPPRLRFVVDHLWERRALARVGKGGMRDSRAGEARGRAGFLIRPPRSSQRKLGSRAARASR